MICPDCDGRGVVLVDQECPGCDGSGEVNYMKSANSGAGKRAEKGLEPGPRPATVRLRWPVTIGGQQVSSLTMRPPLARDSRDAQRAGGTAAEIELRMYANLCEVTPETVAALHLGDYMRLQKQFEGFLAAD